MKRSTFRGRIVGTRPTPGRHATARLLSVGLLAMAAVHAWGQDDVAQRVQQLTDAMSKIQAQMDASQKQLEEMRQELSALQTQISTKPSVPDSEAAQQMAAELSAKVADLRDRDSMQDAQIATLDQTKVESESKYPVKINGLILLNGFVNTRAVDATTEPTLAVWGNGGSSGATMRQTILGLDARGPHLFGARSHGDIRVDFDGTQPVTAGYAGGYGVGLVRLRTAHAQLDWDRTEAFFALDRPILSPNAPDSLAAVAQPAFSWSGNLWTWNPQFGVMHDISLSERKNIRGQVALVDVADAPNTHIPTSVSGIPYLPATGELSRWPGVETRLALVDPTSLRGFQIGVGGFYAPHKSAGGTNFESWAGTLDYRQPLPRGMEFSGSFYRGLALGGMGGGAYKDYVYRTNGIESYFLSLDDVGGWAQWKQRAGQRLEFNEAFGLDSVPAGQLRPFVPTGSSVYLSLARNRTYTGNVIYTPNAYLLFSLEYRRIESSPVNASTLASDVIGIAAGYKF